MRIALLIARKLAARGLAVFDPPHPVQDRASYLAMSAEHVAVPGDPGPHGT